MTSDVKNGILIWGAGAVGGVVAAYLQRANHPIQVVDVAEDHIAMVRDRGLHIVTTNDDFTIRLPICAPGQVDGQWRLAILAVKAQHTRQACMDLAKHLAPGGTVLALQNGIPADIMADFFDRRNILVSVVNIGSDYEGPGEIRCAYIGGIPIGQVDGDDDAILDEFVSYLKAVHPDSFATADIQRHIWAKHCMNAMLSTTSIAASPMTEIYGRQDFEPVWRGVIGEAVRVALATGYPPYPFGGFDPMAFAPGAPPEQSAALIKAMGTKKDGAVTKTHSGSWRDLAILKRKPESAALIGPIVLLGEKHGVPCPMLARVVEIVNEIEQGEREQSDENLVELLHAAAI